MVDVHSEEYILGQNIRKYRIEKHWSQGDLSNAVDMDRADISKYENGSKGEMGFKTLKRFAKALGVTTDQLLEEDSAVPDIGVTYKLLNEEGRRMVDTMMQSLRITHSIAN